MIMMQLAMVCSYVKIKPQASRIPNSARSNTTSHPGPCFHLHEPTSWVGQLGPCLVFPAYTAPVLLNTHIHVGCRYSCCLHKSSMIFVLHARHTAQSWAHGRPQGMFASQGPPFSVDYFKKATPTQTCMLTFPGTEVGTYHKLNVPGFNFTLLIRHEIIL